MPQLSSDAPDLSALATAAGLGSASLVLISIEGGGRAAVASDAPLSPASMIKVPIAAALAARWAAGAGSPDDRTEVGPEHMTANDAASPLVVGYAARHEELGRLMLVRSDNVATNVLIDVLGRGRINALAAAWGLAGTAVRRKLSGSLPLIDDPEATGRNAHPAGDAARLFELIARDAVPGGAWLRDVLAAQEWNGKLNLGLQPGDRFAHKTGDTDEVSHDGGILTTAAGKRYVLVLYTALRSPDDRDERFGDFMRALRPHLD
jgi:beta-lactamase class A